MEYYFEHPVISGIIPIENKSIIKKLNCMNTLKEGQELNFKNTPPIYIKSIKDNIVILSKNKKN